MTLGQPTRYGKRPSTFLLLHRQQRSHLSHLCGFAFTRVANVGLHYTDRHFFAACSPNTPSKTVNPVPSRRAAPAMRRG
jgi:hypothetical protein